MTGTVKPVRPTTTHAGWGEGHPRLLISSPDERRVFEITGDLVNIGSDDANHIVLPGILPLHATVAHRGGDEYILTMIGPGETSAATASQGRRSHTLRTGARFTAGVWTLVFTREEFADHGRPYGGREGGEHSFQRRQAERPDYEATHGE